MFLLLITKERISISYAKYSKASVVSAKGKLRSFAGPRGGSPWPPQKDSL